MLQVKQVGRSYPIVAHVQSKELVQVLLLWGITGSSHLSSGESRSYRDRVYFLECLLDVGRSFARSGTALTRVTAKDGKPRSLFRSPLR